MLTVFSGVATQYPRSTEARASIDNFLDMSLRLVFQFCNGSRLIETGKCCMQSFIERETETKTKQHLKQFFIRNRY